MSATISVANLSKSYGKVQALKNINLEVEAGEIFGLIGPDGAGKTSLFRILATLLLPDSGSARVAGLDPVRDYKLLRTKLGYMPGRFSLYQDLTVRENLEFFASVFGSTIEENYELIREIYIQIEPFRDRRAGALSGGMKQKLALCCALIHKPEVLLLDEPGTGVDPVSRQEFWDMLRRLRQWGITILVSTPYMDEAEMCDRIALIQQGEILAINTPEGVRKAYPRPLYAVRADDMYRLIRDLRELPGAEACYAFGESAHLSMADPAIRMADIQAYLNERRHEAVEVAPTPATIEDCFIEFLKN